MRRALVRAGLLVVGIPFAATGGWALFAPRSFYRSFPFGAGHAWVAPLGPFNEHLTRDVGALLLALAFLLAVAAVHLEQRLVLTAVITSLIFDIPHLVFHAGHREGLSSLDNALNIGLLGGTVVILVAVGIGVMRGLEG